MSRNTTVMDYESCAAEGFKRVEARDYPDLDDHERRVLDTVAAGLFISKSSIQWAYWNAVYGPQEGRRDAFRGVLKILSGGRLNPVMQALSKK